MIIKIDNDTFLEYLPSQNPRVMKKAELLKDKESYDSRLTELTSKDDAFLLQWAKDNYPGEEGKREAGELTYLLAKINADLEKIAEVE